MMTPVEEGSLRARLPMSCVIREALITARLDSISLII